MLKQIKPALMVFALLTLLTGVLYPLLVTGVAQVIFPYQANGSLVKTDGKVVGSTLIGQYFSSPRYFWGRPSATSGEPYTAYDPVNLPGSTGSNWGPLSQNLKNDVQERVQMLQTVDKETTSSIPADLVTSSASGLDPHISPQAAYYQVVRVAKARGLDESIVKNLITENIEGRQFGILGEPRVNVLQLNLAMDRIQ